MNNDIATELIKFAYSRRLLPTASKDGETITVDELVSYTLKYGDKFDVRIGGYVHDDTNDTSTPHARRSWRVDECTTITLTLE